MRTQYDLEMIQEVGYCNGIENYSMHIDGRTYGEPPFTLLDYFPEDFLLVIDESHQAVPAAARPVRGRPQPQGQSRRARLPPAERPRQPAAALRGGARADQPGVFLSATPGPYELRVSEQVVEQIVRPTGLVDPEVIVKPTKGQIDDLIDQVNDRVTRGDRVLVTTLTKKMAEDLTDYLLEQGLRVRYLHSNIDTIQRIEILRGLRLGEFDVLVGINLLREGLDLPGGVAGRHPRRRQGGVPAQRDVAHPDDGPCRPQRRRPGDHVRRQDHRLDAAGDRPHQPPACDAGRVQHRARHQPADDPQGRRRHPLACCGPDNTAPVPGKDRRRQRERDKVQRELKSLPQQELARLIQTLEEEMHEASAELKFEYAARLRDEINDLRRELRDAG